MKRVGSYPLTFNAYPFHCYPKNKPFSNRIPNKEEVKIGSKYLEILIDWFKPSRIISIGRVAEIALKNIGQKSIYVRHPSCGGQKKFHDMINNIYSGKIK